MDELQWFERIVQKSYPACRFTRRGLPTRGGALNVSKVVALEGINPPGGAQEIADFLALLSESLTIEDVLDESHALAHHQDEDEGGELVWSPLGTAMFRAKYRAYSYPGSANIVSQALYSFIQGHPRYRGSDVIGALPPHEASRQRSLCREIVAAIGQKLAMPVVAILRSSTREPQKNIQEDDRSLGSSRRFENQRGSMEIREDLSDHSIILIDDLYGSGGSMGEACRAARAAGATDVLGLAVTKQRLAPLLNGSSIYAVGNTELLGARAIGICGSRHASELALRWAYEFGKEAAKNGFVVISGYARGVDRQAHRGALEAGGATVAVLAEGIKHLRVPKELAGLLNFETNFLALSMFEPDARWQVWRAMRRNKLIVGLSVGLFVIEARETGGTIDAAREAARQHKRLWAIAYEKDLTGREGNRILIGESAVPLKSTADLRRALDEATTDPPPGVEQLMLALTGDEKNGN